MKKLYDGKDDLTEFQKQIVKELCILTAEERVEVFLEFCTHCGDYTPDYFCQCWNDD